MTIQFYPILLLNIIAILLNRKNNLKSLFNICKVLFVSATIYILYTLLPFPLALSSNYIIPFSISIIFLLFLDNERKTDALLMSVVSINIYLLIENIYYSEFIAFMIYIAIILLLSSRFEKKEKIIGVLKKNILNVIFYTLGHFFIYFSKIEHHSKFFYSDNMYIVYTSLTLFIIVLMRSMEGSVFHPYNEYLDKAINKKYIFKIYLLFALFILPQHLLMLRPLFFLLNLDLQNLFLTTIIIVFILSLFREYLRKESNFTLLINIKLFVMSVILLTFLTKENAVTGNLYYMVLPFVFIHFPCFVEKDNVLNVKTSILNYIFVVCVLGFGPSIVFAVKTYSLVLLLNHHNIYLFFLFVFSTTLGTIKFLTLFIKNRECLIQIKNPFYYIIFLFILCVYFFSAYIPDKM